jgi:hypothetical protein
MLMQQVGLDVVVQIAGKMLSFQSDVFALGTVMWEFLSETVPFSDVHDPLKQDLPTMAIALNTRHIFMRSDMPCVQICMHAYKCIHELA